MHRYFDDDEATRACFDDEGFYKTGDRAHRVGEDYYFDGRNSCDCTFNFSRKMTKSGRLMMVV